MNNFFIISMNLKILVVFIISKICAEQEYLMYIADNCREIREFIDKLYQAKMYIIKNDLSNKTEFYRDKIVYK